MFAKVCDAVAYAHQRGVLHRDLRPATVVVSEHGDVLTVDWGLFKVVGAASEEEDPDDAVSGTPLLTRAGRVSGTPAYMSPEQARGDAAAVDRRSDVWALGAVPYELLTGAPPYEGRDVRSILRQVLAGPPPDPREFGGAFETVSLDAATISFDPEPVARRPLPEALVAVWARFGE